MAFTFAAMCYIMALIATAVLSRVSLLQAYLFISYSGKPFWKIFFAIWHLIAFDELQHDYKNPVDQCNSLNPLVLPEYAVHLLIVILMFSCGEMSSATINIPLLCF